MSLTLQDIAEIAVSHGEDEAQQYLQQIRAIPRLTYEQERALAKRCAAGDEEAIRMMVSANLRLVVSVAREYAGRGVPLMDLIQEGSIGLLTAARKFDYTLDYRFSTYATKWIRQGVTRSILNHTGLIRVPVHTAERIRKVLSVKAALQQELEREPTIPELAEKTGFSEKGARISVRQSGGLFFGHRHRRRRGRRPPSAFGGFAGAPAPGGLGAPGA